MESIDFGTQTLLIGYTSDPDFAALNKEAGRSCDIV